MYKIKLRAITVRTEKRFNLFTRHFNIQRLHAGQRKYGVIKIGPPVAVKTRALG